MAAFNPLQYRSGFFQPAWIAPSQWLEHVPFGMTVVEMLRPLVVVELGSFAGVSYCSFCQAIHQLGLASKAYAVDTWEGDPHSGYFGPEVYQSLSRYHDTTYGSFSRLIRATFDDALRHFSDGAVDLLHIDGYHTYDAVRHDYEHWLPKMSESGVMLFHDVNVRQEDFGVWKFWEETRTQGRSFEFLHQHGLGIHCPGTTIPESLVPLLKSTAGEVQAIRAFYSYLGDRLSLRVERDRLACSLRQHQERLARQDEQKAKISTNGTYPVHQA